MKELFTAALGLQQPWRVADIRLHGEPKQLELRLEFERGARFALAEAGHQLQLPVHDTVERRWRHLNFFQFRCELVAKVPRVKLPDGRVVTVEVPWARPQSRFTLRFEALALLLAREMTMAAAADYLGEHDTRLWRAVGHHVEVAHARTDWSQVRAIGIDETSAKKGQRYVSIIMDAVTRAVLLLLVVAGHGKESLHAFARQLRAHGGHPDQIESIALDMSRAFIAGAKAWFPKARLVFDRFHVMQKTGEAIDEVRKQLVREGQPGLEGALWALRGNEWNLSAQNLQRRRELAADYKQIGRALALRGALQDVYALATPADAPGFLKWWCGWAQRSRLRGFVQLARTIRAHWKGVLAFFTTGLTTAAMEAMNSVLQMARRRARGFRSFKNLQTITYLLGAKLEFDLPSLKPA